MRRTIFSSSVLFVVMFANGLFAQTPAVTSISPTTAVAGSQVTITGTNFGSGGGTVIFGSIPYYYPSSWTDTQITTTVPTNAQTGLVYVQPLGGPQSNSVNLTVVYPNISSITPTQAVAGLTQVTITGTNFGSTNCAVLFGNIPYYWTTSWNDTQIVTLVPASAQSGPVYVQTSLGALSNPVNLTMVYPTISSITPTTAYAGATQVTISGEYFGTTGFVVFGNIPYYWPTSWTDTQIVILVPSNASSGSVYVENYGGAQSNSVNLTVVPAPDITSISPTIVSPGGQVTITGTNLGSAQGAVELGGGEWVWGLTVTSWSDTQVVATVPTAGLSGVVWVTTEAGAPSNQLSLTVLSPSISSVSPTTVSPGGQVTITGTNLGSAQGSVALSNGTWDWGFTVTSWNNTQVVATAPAGGLSGVVWVTTQAGAQSNQLTLAIAPAIANLSSSSGSVGTSVVITGTNFGGTQGRSTVTFGGVLASPTSWSDSSITVPAPAGATTGYVVVTVNGVASNGVLFTLTTYANAYQYRQTIDLAHTQVVGTDQTDFPVVISGVYPDLATVANGGFVQNSNGYDIIFSQDPEGASNLDHEIDSYDPVTGTASFWVRIPTLSHTVDTVIYMFYGNPNVTVSQENKAGVWKNGYAAVWHFGSSTSLSPSDSTANANNATNNGVTPTAGLFGGAGSFDGAGNTYLRIPSSNSFKPTAAITLEAWVNMAVAGANYQDILSLDYNATNGSWSTPYRAYGMGFNDNSLVPWFDLAVSGGQLPIGPSAIANGQWTQVVGTYDGNNVILYTNGAPVATTAETGAISYGTSQDLAVGIRSPYSPGEPVKGLIDEVRISTVARSAGWIATGYANESSPSTFYAVDGPVTAGSAPTIQNLLPSAGSSGDVVTIQGGGFESSQGGSTVTFNGLPATPTTWNDASIVVLVPAGATSGNVVVTVNGAASNAVPFTVPPPNITSLSPSSGVEGTQVAITGRNFGNPQGSSTVSFNGTPAAPIDWSDTNIIVPVPAGGTTGNVVVTVTGTASNGVTFTVVPGTGTTALSDSMGRNTNYGYQNIGGRNFMTSIVGTGCASCGGRGNTTLTYDALGNVQSSTDALNNTASYTYDSMGNVLSKTQYLNPTTPMTWSYTYNAFQEVLTARDPLGNVTTNVYDANGNLLSTTTPPPSGSGSGLTTSFQYNALGELTQVTDPKGNITSMTYTPAGLVASITDAKSNITTFTYDGRGNRLTSVDALNNTTSYTYDAMNRLIKITAPDLSTTQFAYDTRGRRISVTDANAKTTAYGYDDADRLTSVTDAAQNVTIYGYDTENNMVDITDAASHQTGFAYDALGRVTQVTFPSTLSEGYTYDAMNNLLTKSDRKEQTISYGYDALYRLTSKTYPDQTAVNYTYDPLSRLTQVTDPTGAYSFTYDNLGRLLGTGTQYSFLSSALNNSYTYDAASNRVSFSNPQSQITNYTYDSLNRLTSLTDPNTGSFTFGYDALGRRTSLDRPNGVNTSYTYDTLSRLLSVQHGANIPGTTSYGYDAAGNRTGKTAIQAGNPDPVPVTSQYSYDNIYELTQAVVGGTLAERYSYDAVGNRLTSAGPTSYTVNASNELTSSSTATYTYDNNGNTVSKTTSAGTTNYTWDFENRLTSATLPGTAGTVSFKYDPFGRRIEKVAPTSGTTIYGYDGDKVTEEFGAAGNLLAQYTQGASIDEPLAIAESGGTYFYHPDGLGSITSLTNGSGQLAASYVYDSFGNLTASTGTITNPFQYTGREFDLESSLYYYRARYYDSTTGRFMSEDPSGPNQGPNPYAYVYNSPIGSVDPSGLYTIDKSCQGKCLSLGGGGPNNPSKLPQQVNFGELLGQAVDNACATSYTITDLKLRKCIQKSCSQGTIKCDCGSNEGGFDTKVPLLTNRTAHVCFKDWPSWTDPSYAATWYGQTAIHEWAHGCGWNHGDGKGVPNDTGRGH